MLKVYLEKLTVPPKQAIVELTAHYAALKEAAIRENNLREFVSAELTLATLEIARYMLQQPGCYMDKAHYLKATEEDSTEGIHKERLSYVFNGPIG